MNRERALERLRSEQFDILIIGGGATGLGAALDAAARGYRTALIEAFDFAKATSSRSTKLIHGGVRYLRQGNIALVREALHERGLLRNNATHLVQELEFVVPAFDVAHLAYYWAGLKAYDALATGSRFSRSRVVSKTAANALLPALAMHRLRGAVLYSDAQFDDARLAIALARSAVDHGAALANYVRADALTSAIGRLSGVAAVDVESGERFTIAARAVVNATGIFTDAIRRMDDPNAERMLTFSRGSHIVLSAGVLGNARAALLIPRTSDGRVLFAIPWLGHTLVGTTDIAASNAEIDPHASDEEVDYIIATLNRYLERSVSRDDVLAAWAGLRPLVKRSKKRTARLSREHAITVSRSGLVSITGGKWTTYRKMAQDTVDAAAAQAHLPVVPCPTAQLKLNESAPVALSSMREAAEYFAREEMARTVEDVLARRTRTLFLDAKLATSQAEPVAAGLAAALGRDASWQNQQVQRFQLLASAYTVSR